MKNCFKLNKPIALHFRYKIFHYSTNSIECVNVYLQYNAKINDSSIANCVAHRQHESLFNGRMELFLNVISQNLSSTFQEDIFHFLRHVFCWLPSPAMGIILGQVILVENEISGFADELRCLGFLRIKPWALFFRFTAPLRFRSFHRFTVIGSIRFFQLQVSGFLVYSIDKILRCYHVQRSLRLLLIFQQSSGCIQDFSGCQSSQLIIEFWASVVQIDGWIELVMRHFSTVLWTQVIMHNI